MTRTTIGLIGYGAIGREVAAQLSAEAAPTIVVLDKIVPADTAGFRCVQRAEDLIAAAPSLVIEAAGHAAVSEHVIPVLEAGIPVIVVSVGSLADDALRNRLKEASEKGRADVVLPGGAIGGVDYLRAVSRSANLQVRYCSRKPIAAWAKELAAKGHDPSKIDREIALFEGSARDAALAFPQNLNVAMTLALAGPGVDAIAVRVVADPKARGNTHEIDIESAAGRARFVLENSPSPANPKTSALAALSIIQAVRERLKLGGGPL
jgi:aspartate dehydrogenase